MVEKVNSEVDNLNSEVNETIEKIKTRIEKAENNVFIFLFISLILGKIMLIQK